MPRNALDAAGAAPRASSPNLLEQAAEQYPVLRKYNFQYKLNPSPGKGYLEFWPPDEPGAPDWKRPDEFPLDQPGLEVFDPKTRPIDIMGDVASHYLMKADPRVAQYYKDFQSSISPKQNEILADQYNYAKQNNGETRSFDQWKELSGMPAYFRGYAFDQWPAEFNRRAYTPDQMRQFDQMLRYLRTGE